MNKLHYLIGFHCGNIILQNKYQVQLNHFQTKLNSKWQGSNCCVVDYLFGNNFNL